MTAKQQHCTYMSVLGTANVGSLNYAMFCPVEASRESVMELYLAAVLYLVGSAIPPTSPTPQLVTRTTKNKTHTLVMVCGTFSAKRFLL